MAALFTYDEKDVPKFKEEMCPKCILKGKCITDGKDNHWFLMCPHYHKWKVGYGDTFVEELLRYQRTHEEEMKADAEKRKTVAKKLQAEKRAKKKAEAEAEKEKDRES